ncbi:MAG: right-handed parallel beta-helix repeat-containing protein [Planctomycetota bacterium]
MNRRSVAALFLAVAAPALGQVRALGPLTPPPGPVSDTGPSLQDVEPRVIVNAANTPGNSFAEFVISAPGSYYLDRDLDLPGTKTAIFISASDVTLDLNGFTITAAAQTALINGIGVSADPNQNNVRVRNGALRGFGENGVALGQRSIVENVRVIDTGLNGILTGRLSVVTDCSVEGGGIAGSGGTGTTAGITVGDDSAVRNSVVFDHRGDGVEMNSRCTATGVAVNNTGRFGIIAGPIAVIESCRVQNVGSDGIFGQDGSVITNCSVRDAGGIGIFGGNSSRVAGSVVNRTLNGAAIQIGSEATVENCTAAAAGSAGIIANSGSVVRDCLVNFAQADGVFAEDGASVIGCQIRNSGANGITGIRRNRITGNTIDGFTRFGVSIDEDSLIDSNVISGSLTVSSIAAIEIGAGFSRVTRNEISLAGSTGVPEGDTGSYIVGDLTQGIGSVFFGPSNDTTSPWTNVID